MQIGNQGQWRHLVGKFGRTRPAISFVQMDGDCENFAEKEEVEESADVPVSDAGADDVRRDHLMRNYHCARQSMEKVYRNARKEYEEDHEGAIRNG